MTMSLDICLDGRGEGRGQCLTNGALVLTTDL